MSLLNKQAYTVIKDKLIYDAKHPIDATAVQVSVSTDTNGILKRGQILDCAGGVYSIHEEDGEASVIVAEDTGYASDDTEIRVPVYISGSFRASEVITDTEITSADIETLRARGIYLK